jgi:hypothetical protein
MYTTPLKLKYCLYRRTKMATAAENQKKQEQTHEQSRKSSSVVKSLKLDPAPAITTRAQAHSPATGNIVYTGLGGNSDESRVEEKSAAHRSTVRIARRSEMEKLIDKDRKVHGS